MSATPAWPWVGIVLLGIWHGINPGMGWLFAVALGLQEGEGRAVWRALPPLALGHGLAIAGTILLAALVGWIVPPDHLKWVVVVMLVGFGAYRLFSHRHPQFGGMRVGGWDLTVWSFLVAMAHGAGLMVLPFVLGLEHSHAGGHAGHLLMIGDPAVGLAATAVHSAAYLLVMTLLAWLVYAWLGLRLLRQAWFNVDVVWAAVLVMTGALTAML